MLRPFHLVIAARLALALGALGASLAMLLPELQGVEAELGLSDKQAHAAVFYILANISFLAAPGMRRTDLALAAIALGAGVELTQILTGREASVVDLAANALGVALAWLPTVTDEYRRLCRRYPYLKFREIRQMDRRRGSGARVQTPSRQGRTRSAPEYAMSERQP